MSRQYKHVYPNFRYIECDDFAAYLEKMASEGWILDSWPSSLKFRKEEPQELHYAVDIFPKTTDNDMSPTPATEEFAEYCRAAGWEFIDSRRKFCVFKQIRDDAVPIETEEEKFRNVTKAEGNLSLGNMIVDVALSVLWISEGLTLSFPEWFFSNFYLLIMVIWGAMGVGSVISYLSFIIFRQRTYRLIEVGEQVYYGKHKRSSFPARWGWAILVSVLLIGVMLTTDGMEPLVPIVAAAVAACLFVLWLISRLRPSRGESIAASVTLPFILLIIVMVAVFIAEDSIPDSSDLSQAPFNPADYTGVSESNVRMDSFDISSSIFGREVSVSLYYNHDEEHVSYWVYDSSWNALLNACEGRLADRYFGGSDPSDWYSDDQIDKYDLSVGGQTVSIQKDSLVCIIRYPKRLILIRSSSTLTDDEAQKITEIMVPEE